MAVREKSKKQLRIIDAVKLAESVGMPAWVKVDSTKLEGVFSKAPDRDEFGAEINESLIVEFIRVKQPQIDEVQRLPGALRHSHDSPAWSISLIGVTSRGY